MSNILNILMHKLVETELREVRLERALLAAVAELQYIQENYRIQADRVGCDASNWDGGSHQTCEHCQWIESANKIDRLLGQVQPVLESVAKARVGQANENR